MPAIATVGVIVIDPSEFTVWVSLLDFSLAGYHWPAFNIADSAIVMGALLLVTEIFFSKPAEEKKTVPAKQN